MTDVVMKVVPDGAPRRIAKGLWGVFIEDINYAADGGLASNIVQNGAFEYSREDDPDWSAFTAWRRVLSDECDADFGISVVHPVAEENPHHAVVEVRSGVAGLENLGFDGMSFRFGETYRLSLWLRNRGSGSLTIRVRLLGDAGESLVEGAVQSGLDGWSRVECLLTIPPRHDGDNRSPFLCHRGRLRLDFPASTKVEIDFVNLEPSETYRGLRHFRADLVAAIAELHPHFIRFPGGCITHGLGLDNMYDWKSTLGPVEHRPHDFNLWGYHQSFRIGYLEYLLLCETVGASPLPVLPAAVTCQNVDGGSQAVPSDGMHAYIADVLDFIEFCNGDPSTSEWGRRRAALGHPAPFGLRRLAIGNEDRIDETFIRRFTDIVEAVRREYPEITLIGTSGPSPAGREFERGWDLARRMGVLIVDEHAYESSSWWFRNLHRYDDLDRHGPKVYLGEYGSCGSMLVNALSEAAFMSHLEFNGDVVSMASYAPLLARNGHHSWDPDLIYFDGERVYRSYSYWVQRMFAMTATDEVLPVTVSGPLSLRLELPDDVALQAEGDSDFELKDIRVTVGDGTAVSVPDIHHRSGDVDKARLTLHADSYIVEATMVHLHGLDDAIIGLGDVDGPHHNVVVIGQRFAVQAVRDGTAYDLASSDLQTSVPESGKAWTIRIEVSERGRRMRLLVDGRNIVEGSESPSEVRRTAVVAWDTDNRVAYVRIVNAMGNAVDVDVSAVLGSFGMDAELCSVPAWILSGPGPYAGAVGKESPTEPVSLDVKVDHGVYRAPAWSFSILAISRGEAHPFFLKDNIGEVPDP